MLVVFWLVGMEACKKNETPNPVNGDSTKDSVIFAVDIGNSKIPYVIITTSDSIKNEPKIPATLRIFENHAEVQTVNIGIEYRGSTSFRISDKKSYGIETWDADGNDLTVSLFGFPEEEDWMFTGHVVNLTDKYIFDRTLMYHYLAYNLFADMGHYSSRTKFVELELNGEYQGVYVFMEKLKRDKHRIDINKLKADDTDITGGYILKIDKTTGGDQNEDKPLSYFLSNWDDDARYTADNSFRSDYDINGQPISFAPYGPPYNSNMYLETYFVYDYPKASDITSDQKTYIQQYVHDFETALLNDDFSTDTRTYTNYIDLYSFVDFFLINEICRNVDGYRLSTYLYKDQGGKLNMGPVWDFNIGYDTGDRIPWDDWVINYNNYVNGDAWMMPFWWPRLMEDPIFRSAVKVRWTQLRGDVLSNSSILGLVDNTANHLKTNGAVQRNYDVWDKGIGVDYDGSVQSLKDFLNYRLDWMDGQISGF